MAAPKAKSKRDQWKALLAQIAAEAAQEFPGHQGKLEQLDGALATASMVVDDMHDYPPYILPTT